MSVFRIVGDGSARGTNIFFGEEQVLHCRLLEIKTDCNNRDSRLKPIVVIELIQCEIDINNTNKELKEV